MSEEEMTCFNKEISVSFKIDKKDSRSKRVRCPKKQENKTKMKLNFCLL
jgi:hypothetical protein